MTDADAVLIQRAQAGDTLAMAELLDRLCPYVARVCGPIALSSAADASQEALIAIFRSLGSLSEPAALYGWTRSIAVREALRAARRDTRIVSAEVSELPAVGDPQLSADIHDVLRRLSPEHRAILVLRDIEGFSEQEAAALLEVATGTVKSRLARARATFRKAWSS